MPDTTNASSTTYQCRHLFTDGHRCGSRSLHGEAFCFYHHKTRKPFPKAAPAPPAEATFDLPFPEDRAAIQLSIGEVLQRIARNQIDPRRAGLLLYGLQIASLNLPPHPRQAPDRPRSAYAHRGRRLFQDHTPESDDSQPADTYETHPDYGTIAPVAEYTEPEEAPSFFSELYTELGEDRHGNPLPTIQAAAATETRAPYSTAPSPRASKLTSQPEPIAVSQANSFPVSASQANVFEVQHDPSAPIATGLGDQHETHHAYGPSGRCGSLYVSTRNRRRHHLDRQEIPR